MTETMTGGVVTVLLPVMEPGGTTRVPTQTSMGCTFTVGVTAMASHGTILMPLLQVGSHFAIQK